MQAGEPTQHTGWGATRVAAGALLAALAVLAPGCSQPPPFDVTSPAPLTALPACEAPPAAAADGEVAGLVLPEGGIVTGVEPGTPLTSVTAYVGATPIALRQQLEARGDLEMLISEDEVYEAELLVSDGSYRTYLKATAVCAEGSTLLAVVAPELDAAGLPIPQGSPSPGAPVTEGSG